MTDIVLTLEFCHDITIWNMMIYEKVNYIDFEPAPGFRDLHRNMNGLNINLIKIRLLRHVLAQRSHRYCLGSFIRLNSDKCPNKR